MMTVVQRSLRNVWIHAVSAITIMACGVFNVYVESWWALAMCLLLLPAPLCWGVFEFRRYRRARRL